MRVRMAAASAAISIVLASFGVAAADTAPLSVSCSGSPASSSITWTATSVGGVAPIAFVWGNGSTSTVQTISYAPGTYTMTIQATDASSTANSTCTATVATPAVLPAISSFVATPAAISLGQSAVLSWTVTNASSTSINNGVGTVSNTSVSVSPSVTTTYTLSAVNPSGTVSATTTVTVNATSTATSTPGQGVQDRINALIQLIASLKAQLAQLIAAKFGGTVDNPGFIPPGQIGKAACIELNRDLHLGSRGDDVKSIQEMLSEDDELGFDASTTGVFGPITARAMQKFQRKHGIASAPSGTVGALTRGFLHRSCGKGLTDDHGKSSNATTSSDRDGSHSTASSTLRGRGDDEHENSNASSSESHGNNGGKNSRDY